MSVCDNTEQGCSEERHSLIGNEKTFNTKSPSSPALLHTSSGSSPDERVAVKRETCKRNLFHQGVSEIQDQPIDLSLRKPKRNLLECRLERNCREYSDNNFTTDHNSLPKRARMDVFGKSVSSPSQSKILPCQSQDVEAPIFPNPADAPTYIPWTLGPRPGRMPSSADVMSALWHPAFLMSQAGRQPSPVLPSYPFAMVPNVHTPFPTGVNFNHFYRANVLAEFSRICGQRNRLYGPPRNSEAVPRMNDREEHLPDGVHAMALSNETEGQNDVKNGVGVQVKIEALPQERAPTRKRKYNDAAADLAESRNRTFGSFSQGFANSGYNRSPFSQLTFSDSPPTMVPKHTPSILRRDKPLTVTPIDFKPYRYPCNDCGRTYATVGGLLKHTKSHHDPGSLSNFKCTNCDKQYTSLGALKMHIRTHTLPCKCHVCGKAFSRTWLLQGHIRTHTGEKPYGCSVCSRAFADRSNLRAHMQTHESVKRYACKSCDKTFSRISLLNRHQVSGCNGTPSS